MTQQTMFMHYRAHDANGVAACGGATVAIRKINGMAVVGIAECSKHDVYNRKIGRNIAEGRLHSSLFGKESKHVISVEIITDLPVKKQVASVLSDQMNALGYR